MIAGLESSYPQVVPQCLVYVNACVVGCRSRVECRKRFAIFPSDYQRHNFLLPSHYEVHELDNP